MNNPVVQREVQKYEAFINDVLKADLAELSNKLDKKNTDIAEFTQLKSIITTLQNTDISQHGFKTQVDIGNCFFIEAHVPNASNILVDVGLGHFLELTLDEALIFINLRIKLLEQQVMNLRKAVVKTNSYIKMVLLTIRNLQGLENV